ncbi:MAG TPA: zinc ribbon domain-containing protein [Candidatus Aminicenantes bacterium]|nr:zinc ribbon domain-containing protein [Candidatus Aminicenantes bacterium]HRY64172.1 zinc ribbon domain-containing protein [Candidatus Aminicenantes bacterium]HRZ71085.1 zinc ribbon domain-containing protein [Candidatus Aminicenantes bacterium]
MPIYEYQCKKCRETTEVLQKAKDKPLEKCPKCGGAVVKRISSPAIQFKGSGWYITDYAKKDSVPAGHKARSGGAAKTETRAETKTEAKTEGQTGTAGGAAGTAGAGCGKSSS